MNIFLSTSFSSKVDTNGVIFADHRDKLESLCTYLEREGHTVFCAPRQEQWRLSPDANHTEAFRLDLVAIDESSIMLVLLESQTSAGVQIEIGYAIAKKKTIIFAIEVNTELQWSNKAVAGFEMVSVVQYSTVEDLVMQLGAIMPSRA